MAPHAGGECPWIWLQLLELASIDVSETRQGRFPLDWGKSPIPPRDMRARALEILARGWDRVPPELASVAAAVGEGHWAEVAERAWAAGGEAAAPALAALIRDVGGPTCWGLLARLACIEGSAGDDASRVLIEIASGISTPDLSEKMLDAIARAMQFPQARVRREMAWTALTLLERSPFSGQARASVVAVLTGDDSQARRAMVGVLRWDRHALTRAAALRWCVVEPIAAACVDRISRAGSIGEHEAVLRMAHLAERPLRARRLAIVPIGPGGARHELVDGGPLPTERVFDALSREAQRMIPRLVGACGGENGTRGVAIEPLLTAEEELVRLAAVTHAPAPELRDLCFDESKRVATSAMVRWSRAGVAPAQRSDRSPEIDRVMGALRSSPHAAVRRMAEQDLRGSDVLDASSPASRLAARRRLLREGDAFVRELASLIVGSDTGRAAAAVRIVDALGLVPACEDAIIKAIRRHPEGVETLVASAVRALGHARSEEAFDAVQRVLIGRSDRACAHALDALAVSARRNAVPVPVLGRVVELKGVESNRVRGAAARAMAALAGQGDLKLADAASAIRAMLDDDRPIHRAAGMWAARRALPLLIRDEGGRVALEYGRKRAASERHAPDEILRRQAALLEASLAGGTV